MYKLINLFNSKINHIPLYVSLIILLCLLARNPFSHRTLIPNFEPFPDALYYVVPPRCFAMGQGWKMCRQALSGFPTEVPPLYSIVLLPVFLFSDDPRMFYFANVALSVLSVCILYAIINRITKNVLIKASVLFLFVTNYFVYWYPSLAMAENLLIPLYLMGIYLSISAGSVRQLSLLGLVAVALYQTKHAYAPLVLVFGAVMAYQLFQHPKVKKYIRKYHNPILPVFFFGLPLIVLAVSQYHNILWILTNDFFLFKLPAEAEKTAWFSLSYALKHIPKYASIFSGTPQHLLWDKTPLVHFLVGIFGCIGLILGLRIKKHTRLSLTIIMAIIGQVLFISTFYAFDVRYVFHILPSLLIGTTIVLSRLEVLSRSKNHVLLFTFVLLGLMAGYSLHSLPRLRKQVALNLKYAETPWWYISVQEIGNYFDTQAKSTFSNPEKQPIIITAIPPFLFDFYLNKSPELLPMHPDQDFRQARNQTWGENDYTDFIALYQTKLKEGRDVYVSNYGIAGAGHFAESFDTIKKTFGLTEVHTGCHQLCNLYKLELK